MSFHSRTSFGQSKRTIETKLARACGDKSPKGFLDEPIADLVDFINGHPEYVTTSSCSGRIVLFATFEKKMDSCEAWPGYPGRDAYNIVTVL